MATIAISLAILLLTAWRTTSTCLSFHHIALLYYNRLIFRFSARLRPRMELRQIYSRAPGLYVYRNKNGLIYIREQERAITSKNIESAWSGAGLIPWNPQKAYNKMPSQPNRNPTTPQNKPSLDSSLLSSSPPDGTELRDSNEVLRQALVAQEALKTPTRKYISLGLLTCQKCLTRRTQYFGRRFSRNRTL